MKLTLFFIPILLAFCWSGNNQQFNNSIIQMDTVTYIKELDGRVHKLEVIKLNDTTSFFNLEINKNNCKLSYTAVGFKKSYQRKSIYFLPFENPIFFEYMENESKIKVFSQSAISEGETECDLINNIILEKSN